MNGYIPEGGVWTATERDNTMGDTGLRAVATVAALIRALEDEHADFKSTAEHDRHPCPTCALLAEVTK